MTEDWKGMVARARAALMRRGRTEHDADDLVQEAWLRLATYRKDQDVEQPEAFLMRAALNLSIDAHRTRVHHGEEVRLEHVVLIDPRPGIEAAVLARERVARLTAGIARLPDKTRQIFLEQRMENASYGVVARRHGISVSAVEKHMSKAIKDLTMWMEGW